MFPDVQGRSKTPIGMSSGGTSGRKVGEKKSGTDLLVCRDYS
jgi:hypothetical protein